MVYLRLDDTSNFHNINIATRHYPLFHDFSVWEYNYKRVLQMRVYINDQWKHFKIVWILKMLPFGDSRHLTASCTRYYWICETRVLIGKTRLSRGKGSERSLDYGQTQSFEWNVWRDTVGEMIVWHALTKLVRIIRRLGIHKYHGLLHWVKTNSAQHTQLGITFLQSWWIPDVTNWTNAFTGEFSPLHFSLNDNYHRCEMSESYNEWRLFLYGNCKPISRHC